MLTDARIRKAPMPLKPTKLADERGLFLKMTPAGGRLWRFKFRFAGKEKVLALGKYPDVTLSKARDARDDARRLLAQGIDPSATKRSEKRTRAIAAANSFEMVAREWLANVEPKWKAVTHADTTKRLETYVFPSIGHRPISAIGAPELLDVLRKAEARGIVLTAHKVANHCKQIFRYGIVTGRCERNPAVDIQGALKSLPKAKPMAVISANELPEFLGKIGQYAGEEVTEHAIWLLALTMVRTTELRLARWTELDLDRAEWTIPAERMSAKILNRFRLSKD